MGLTVLPALIPDLPKVYDAYFAAFKGDAILSLLFPGGTEGEDFRAEHTKNTVDYWHKSPTQYTLKCVDSETGEIVGMALWDVFLKERTYDEYKFPGITWLKGEERARAEELITPICDVKAKLWGGRPHVCEWNP